MMLSLQTDARQPPLPQLQQQQPPPLPLQQQQQLQQLYGARSVGGSSVGGFSRVSFNSDHDGLLVLSPDACLNLQSSQAPESHEGNSSFLCILISVSRNEMKIVAKSLALFLPMVFPRSRWDLGCVIVAVLQWGWFGKSKNSAKPADEDMLIALAHKKYKAGNYKQALEHSNAVYEKNPRRTDNLLLLGAIYYQLNDFDMCIKRNEEAICIDPHFGECYGNMANAWKEKGNIDLAIRYYLTAIEVRIPPYILNHHYDKEAAMQNCCFEFRPNFSDAWSNLSSGYMRKGRLNEAAQCCRQALALNPRLVDAHSNLGNLMKAQGLIKEAFNCYTEALRINPGFAIAWSNLAGLFMEAGKLDRALTYYKVFDV
ncbi:hypothetical protein ACLOJK_022760 [Asimina triloba]